MAQFIVEEWNNIWRYNSEQVHNRSDKNLIYIAKFNNECKSNKKIRIFGDFINGSKFPLN